VGKHAEDGGEGAVGALLAVGRENVSGRRQRAAAAEAAANWKRRLPRPLVRTGATGAARSPVERDGCIVVKTGTAI